MSKVNYPVHLQAERLNRGALPDLLYSIPDMDMPEQVNITEHFLDRNLHGDQADRVAFYSGDRQITYRELNRLVNRLGNGLSGLGIEQGDRVVLRIQNSIEFVVCALALHRIGAVVIPTMILLREGALTHIANTAEVKAIISESNLLDEIELGRSHYQTAGLLIAIGGNNSELRQKGYLAYDELTESASDQLESVRVNRDDLAVVFFSSGTTGMPKGCMHAHRTVIAATNSSSLLFSGMQQDDVISGTPPLAFVFGYGHLMLLPMLHGVPSVLIEGRFTSEKIFHHIQRHKITIFNSAPSAYNQILSVPDAEKKYDLSSLRVALSGSAPLPLATYQEWKSRFGLNLINTIGSSETFLSYLATWKPESKPTSLGHPTPGWEARVIDDAGQDCQRGTVGRLVVRGPGGIMYWRNPEKQAEAVIDGWSLTGDLVYQDEDGCFWHISRADDIIKSRGYRVSPGEVEDALLEHPAVFESAVIGVPDEIQGQRVKAFVVLNEGWQGSSTLAEELRQFVRERIAPYQVPREIEFIASLPKTETGKVRRVELRQKAAAR